ncbi:hypothetical protein HanIR_Chr10g0500971 [Helianthus annuus]|nr:hypothetical protein HanIR_Chr10g0500971 [Helianthus annuus]
MMFSISARVLFMNKPVRVYCCCKFLISNMLRVFKPILVDYCGKRHMPESNRNCNLIEGKKKKKTNMAIQ